MKPSSKIVLAAAALLTAALPMAAFAAPPKAKPHAARPHEEYSTGAITSVSATELKLASGDTFKFAAGASAGAFKAGDKVSVRWQLKDGAKLADQVMAAKN